MEPSTPDIPTRPAPAAELDQLGDEIAELSAHIEAATAHLLDLIREFDARGGWANGFRSCAAWLTWRVGLSPGAGPGPPPAVVPGARSGGTLVLEGARAHARGDAGDGDAAARGGARRLGRACRAHRPGLAPDGRQGRGAGDRPAACEPRAAGVSGRGRYGDDSGAARARGRGAAPAGAGRGPRGPLSATAGRRSSGTVPAGPAAGRRPGPARGERLAS